MIYHSLQNTNSNINYVNDSRVYLICFKLVLLA